MKVQVGVSNHHVHLCKEDLELLFGNNYELTKYKDLKQYGQFASVEKVDIRTDKNIIKGLRILGPIRDYTQVEISKTECYLLGVDAPVRDSGDLEGAGEIEIIGPRGSIKRNALIISNRHIHITREKREELGLVNEQKVKVKVSTEKGGVMDDVYIKEGDNSYFELHIDTDDANAFLLKQDMFVEIIK